MKRRKKIACYCTTATSHFTLPPPHISLARSFCMCNFHVVLYTYVEITFSQRLWVSSEPEISIGKKKKLFFLLYSHSHTHTKSCRWKKRSGNEKINNVFILNKKKSSSSPSSSSLCIRTGRYFSHLFFAKHRVNLSAFFNFLLHNNNNNQTMTINLFLFTSRYVTSYTHMWSFFLCGHYGRKRKSKRKNSRSDSIQHLRLLTSLHICCCCFCYIIFLYFFDLISWGRCALFLSGIYVRWGWPTIVRIYKERKINEKSHDLAISDEVFKTLRSKVNLKCPKMFQWISYNYNCN